MRLAPLFIAISIISVFKIDLGSSIEDAQNGGVGFKVPLLQLANPEKEAIKNKKQTSQLYGNYRLSSGECLQLFHQALSDKNAALHNQELHNEDKFLNDREQMEVCELLLKLTAFKHLYKIEMHFTQNYYTNLHARILVDCNEC